jgi:hypothetical protein
MSDLTITTAGVSESIRSGSQKKGTIERVTVASSATAFASGDVMCLSTEIPNATRIQGGLSRIVNVLVLDESATIDSTDGSFQCILTGKQTNLIAALSPGSSGGPDWDDAAAKAANILGYLERRDLDAQCDLVSVSLGMMSTVFTGTLAVTQQGMLIKSESDSTSIYFSLVARDAIDLAAADDLTLVFHIEYLD